MLKKMSRSIAGLIFGSLLLIACGPVATPSSSTDVKGPAPGTVTPAPKGGWEQKWQTFLAEARKEGELFVYTNLAPEPRELVFKGFSDKYGITVNYLALSGGAEVFARASAEQRAGVRMADVFITGASSLVMSLAPAGLLSPIEPLLVLPEVLDPEVWVGKKLAFPSKDKNVFALISHASGAYLYNTDLIKKGEITSFLDPLKPEYKGKVILHDPSAAGGGNSLISHLAYNILDKDRALDFLKQLIREQDVLVSRDLRQQAEWVARGKYSLSLAPGPTDPARFLALGAPIALAWQKEGIYSTASGGGLGVASSPPHPKAAAVFVNWLLTKEGLTLFTQGFGSSSSRLDVPNPQDPRLQPPPDLKVFPESEEYLRAKNEMIGPAREAMAAARK